MRLGVPNSEYAAGPNCCNRTVPCSTYSSSHRMDFWCQEKKIVIRDIFLLPHFFSCFKNFFLVQEKILVKNKYSWSERNIVLSISKIHFLGFRRHFSLVFHRRHVRDSPLLDAVPTAEMNVVSGFAGRAEWGRSEGEALTVRGKATCCRSNKIRWLDCVVVMTELFFFPISENCLVIFLLYLARCVH